MLPEALSHPIIRYPFAASQMALGISRIPSSPWLAPYLISGIAHSRRCRGKLILATSKRCGPIVNTKACGVRKYDLVMHRYFVDENPAQPKSDVLALGKLSKTSRQDNACSSSKNMAIIYREMEMDMARANLISMSFEALKASRRDRESSRPKGSAVAEPFLGWEPRLVTEADKAP
jgi:hypothetical protein